MEKATLPLGDFMCVDKEEPTYVWTPSEDFNLENDLQVFLDEHMMKPTEENIDCFEYHATIVLRAYTLPKTERTIQVISTALAKVVNNYTYTDNNISYSLGFQLSLDCLMNDIIYVAMATLKLYWKLA